MSRAATSTGTDLAVGVGVGAFSGAFGVGGGILLVPFLVLVRHVPQKVAQATSLVMVAMAAAAGATRYALAGNVAWLPGLVILVGGLAGAWVGAHIVQRSPHVVLQVLFGVLLVAAGLRLLVPAQGSGTLVDTAPHLALLPSLGYVMAGLGMGFLSALFGIGGGILLVPILVTGFDYSIYLAAGTSLAVMVPIALLGAVRLTRPGFTQWTTGARYGLGAIGGALVGASIALAVSQSLIQYAFAALMMVVGVHMGWRALSGARRKRG